ncbi:MAG: competence/damage-inducible protein A [Chloroflexi bacterium]|nr:competence/damage-inducible protein A [Chloroflexota bacterium]
MKAEIVSVGTELLLGEVSDTNAGYLASQLVLLGTEVHFITAVDDSMDRLGEVLGRAWARSDLVLVTGGLGPTQDDLTREAVACLLGEEMQVSPPLLQNLRDMFAAIGRTMSDSNIKQATLIPSAQSIPNPRGTAPGWWVERNGRLLITLPGPPQEMQRMWQVEVLPRLQALSQGQALVLRTLKCSGLTEAEAGEMAGGAGDWSNPSLGIYARADGIHLRMIARAASQDEAASMIAAAEARIRAALAGHIWGSDEDSPEAAVGRLLTERGLTLATMESCTGGLLGSLITDVPGSSAYYRGGLVAYSSEVKVAFGVEPRLIEQHGAVSREAAEAMAEAARRRLGADVGLSTTGVAGPEGAEGKAPGLAFIAVSDALGCEAVEGRYPPLRFDMKRRVAIQALFLLRRRLLAR